MQYERNMISQYRLAQPIFFNIEYKLDSFLVTLSDFPQFKTYGDTVEDAFDVMDQKILKFYWALTDEKVRKCIDEKTQAQWDYFDSFFDYKPIREDESDFTDMRNIVPSHCAIDMRCPLMGPDERCYGADCMMWVWVNNFDGYCGLVNMPPTMTTCAFPCRREND